MGGNRFLAPLTLQAWHRIEIHFRVSGRGRRSTATRSRAAW